jgi:hypothetical protein
LQGMRYLRYAENDDPLLIVMSDEEKFVDLDFSPEVLAIRQKVPEASAVASSVELRVEFEELEIFPTLAEALGQVANRVEVTHRITQHQLLADMVWKFD